MTAPCLNCTERHENCHSECERYKEFAAQKPKKRAYSVADEYTLEDVQKKRRRKR